MGLGNAIKSVFVDYHIQIHIKNLFKKVSLARAEINIPEFSEFTSCFSLTQGAERC